MQCKSRLQDEQAQQDRAGATSSCDRSLDAHVGRDLVIHAASSPGNVGGGCIPRGVLTLRLAVILVDAQRHEMRDEFVAVWSSR